VTTSTEQSNSTDETERTHHRAAFTAAIYGVVSIAAVIVTWEADGNDWHLCEIIVGYMVAMWLTHSYAAIVADDGLHSWPRIVRAEFPVAAAALPALVVAALGTTLGWGEEKTAGFALATCAVTLLGIQTNIVRRDHTSRRGIILTIVADMAIFGLILYLHTVF
jgi:hypothetical protein